jgi:hypothetical protein
MIKYLKSQHGNRPSSKNTNPNLVFIVNANERMELQFLREEVRKLKQVVGVKVFHN